MVGEIPRNKAQVYPIVVSGKVAYIRVNDVTTERESMDTTRLTAERFQKNTAPSISGKFAVSYYAFNSTIEIGEELEDDGGFIVRRKLAPLAAGEGDYVNERWRYTVRDTFSHEAYRQLTG